MQRKKRGGNVLGIRASKKSGGKLPRDNQHKKMIKRDEVLKEENKDVGKQKSFPTNMYGHYILNKLISKKTCRQLVQDR